MKIKEIVRGTTPKFQFIFEIVPVTDIEKAVFAIYQCDIPILEKGMTDATVDAETNSIAWQLTQEDTFLLKPCRTAIISMDWVTSDGTRGRSDEVSFQVNQPAKRAVIE